MTVFNELFFILIGETRWICIFSLSFGFPRQFLPCFKGSVFGFTVKTRRFLRLSERFSSPEGRLRGLAGAAETASEDAREMVAGGLRLPDANLQALY
jgi:hypothetical protein